MLGKHIDGLALESRYAVRLMRNDGLRRVSAIALGFAIASFLGTTDQILTFLIVAVVIEVSVRTLLGNIDVGIEHVRRPVIVLIWCALASVMAMLAAPAFLFVSAKTAAAVMTGMLWMVGMTTYASYAFAKMPYFRATIGSLQISLTGFYALWVSQFEYAATTGQEWIMLVGMVIIFALGMSEAVRRQNQLLRALDQARTEADTRMAELEHLTSHDPLTHLKNRRAFDDTLQIMLDEVEGPGPDCVYVFLLDLDGFKPINDSYSHAAGDRLLCALGRRMKEYVGQQGVVARLGGDEFSIAVQGRLSDPEALDLAEKMIRLCTQPVEFDGRDLSVGVSIGISSSRPAERIPFLLSRADQAMYAAKAMEGNQALIYDPVLSPPRASLEMRQTLLDAMARDEIKPYYQPKVDLQTGEIFGFEALARWEHPDDGLLLPGKFLPSIDQLGLQGEFLSHTVEKAMRDIAEIVEAGLQPGEVSVNLPEITLATNSGRDAVLEQLRRHPLALPYLTFEVTENIFISRSSDIIQRSIEQFRRMGVRVSLDDFGTGFASFQNLRELEFDELKLDTAIVSGLGDDPSAKVLVKAFLDIGLGLDVTVVAEGIETEQQLSDLHRMGCRVGQGFLFSKAAPFPEILKMLETKKTFIDTREAA